MSALGKTQRAVLNTLIERAFWYPGCGWSYGTRSAMIRVLESLVRLGLVRKTVSVVVPPNTRAYAPVTGPTYRPTEAARDH